MTILVFYATVEGQTRKIAERVAARLEEKGRRVLLQDAVQPGYPEPGGLEAAFLCAPIHMGRYPGAFVHFVRDWKDVLRTIPTALLTVSLAIRSENAEEREEAEAYPRRLEEATGWHATAEHNAAGALKYAEYDFFKRWIMRRISEAEGGPVDTSRDYEMTDWAALDAFVDGFLKNISGS